MDDLTSAQQKRLSEARALCTDLIREFDEVDLYTKVSNSRLLPISAAWARQVYRFVEAALLLHDNGHGQEALVLQRQALEFTVRLHWLTQLGDPGVDTLLAEHKRSMGNIATDAKGSSLELPQEYLDELGEREIDAQFALGSFEAACSALGVKSDLYVLYRHLSQHAHPTWMAAQTYLEAEDAHGPLAIRDTPKGDWDLAPIMLAALLIWSARSIDDLIEGKPRRQRLRKAARVIVTSPVLPQLVTPPQKAKKTTP